MILLLDTIYAFFESVIYVMYLNIFLKNNQDMRIRNSLLVLILFVSAFVFNHSFLYFKILFTIIVSSIYARHFYKGRFRSLFVKVLWINFNLFFISFIILSFLLSISLFYYISIKLFLMELS